MVARTWLATLVVCVAVDAAAQAHEPATVPAKPAKTVAKEAAAAAPAATAASAHQPPSPGRRPAPVVSRISASPRAAADSGGHAEPDGHAEPAPAAKKGYVAIGASRRPPVGDHAAAEPGHAASGKPRPVVSGAAALQGRALAASAGAVDAATAAPSPPPGAHSGDPGPAVASDGKPTKLSVVHGRLAAALAEARTSSGAATPSAESAAGHAATPRQKPGEEGAAVPRVTLTWPEPRWLLTWPPQSRQATSWPGFAPPVSQIHDDRQ
ncbi:MAG: hypothetical protein KA371_07905 [Acidobacteria bacterium]|mgnify:CR=1 FL=1|nr:hypothetical protein [Acidobacteriota bacterium]